jgi:hypothetical protein
LFHYGLDQDDIFIFDNQSELASSATKTDRANSGEATTKLSAKRPYYFDQHGRVILNSLSKLASSTPEIDRANLGGASTIPSNKRLSYCYFDQEDNLIFRKKPVLVFSVSETDRTNSGGVYTSQTDDGTAAPYASLSHITVLSISPKSSNMVSMPEDSCDASLTNSQKLLIGFGSQKRQNWTCKLRMTEMLIFYLAERHFPRLKL